MPDGTKSGRRIEKLLIMQTPVKNSKLDEICGVFMIYNVYVLSLMVLICTFLSVWFDIPTEEEKIIFGNAYLIVR